MRKMFLGAAFVLPMAVGWATAPVTAEGPGPDAHSLVCAGGAQDPIDVSFEIVAAETTDRGERLTVHAAVHNHFDDRARTILAHEIVDDRGRVVQATWKSRVAATAAGEHRVEVLQTPDELEPGFYQLRVSAAGVTETTKEDSIAVESMFFEVTKHGVLPISHDEFQMRSNAGLAFQAPGSDIEREKEEVKR